MLSLAAIALTALTFTSRARAELRITEVMPNGTGTSELDEWIELMNTGPDPIELSDYRIGDEEKAGGGEGFYAFPSATLAANAFVIVARSGNAFLQTFSAPPGVRVFAPVGATEADSMTKDTLLATGDIGLTNGSGSTGDEVLLLKKIADGHYVLVDGMSYGGSDALTSYTPPGSGATSFIDARVSAIPPELGSIARTSALVDRDLAADWEALDAATPGTAPLNVCGDGVLQTGEACDDGNDAPDDGCGDHCAIECGYTCAGTGPASCAEDCGDGDIAGLEECDDGDDLPGDGCDAACRIEEGFTCTDPAALCDDSFATRSTCTLDPCLLPLRITEVHADGLADPDSEWLELTNNGAVTLDLSSWSFGDQATAGAATEGMIRFDPGLTLAPGATIVLAYSGAVFQAERGQPADYEYGTNSAAPIAYLHRQSDWAPNPNIQLDNAADQLLLACAGVIRDIVRWGPSDPATIAAPSADYSAADPAAGPITFERLGGAYSGTAADWAVSRCPSPGLAVNPNHAPEAAAALVNVASVVSTDLALAAHDPDGDPLQFVLDTTGTLGTVTLLDAGNVRYTPPPGTSPLATSFTFVASDACSTSVPAKVDIVVGAPSCDPDLAALRITEVHADARVDNEGEWIEIANIGTTPIDLGYLRVGDEESPGGNEGMVIFRPGALLAPGEALVLAFSAAAFRDDWDLAADHEWYRDSDGLANDLPHATTWAAGAIRLDNSDEGVFLVDCDGTIIDQVYWGREVPSGTPVEPAWAERLVPTPPWDGITAAGPMTVARRDPDQDTDSPADWYRDRCPTPGVARSPNAAPVAQDAAYAIARNTNLSKTFSATDADSPTLTYTASATAGSVTVTNATTGAFTYRPPSGQTGYFAILFEASDGCAISIGSVRVCVAQDPSTCDLTCDPQKPELCDGKDNDCDPATADGSGDPSVGAPCDSATDADTCLDEVRLCTGGALSCPDVPGGGARAEVCDPSNVDEDCDGGADDLDPQGDATGKVTFYGDLDGDGRGDDDDTLTRCDAAPGYVALGGDCDDDPDGCAAACSPELVESKALGNCSDGYDNDCDGATDSDAACADAILCYFDRDGDGYGRFATEIILTGPTAEGGCAGYADGINPPGSWVANGLDCDDDPAECGAACHPGAAELCDLLDNDCDAATADGTGDPRASAPCDAAADGDRCLDDRTSCQSGAVVCINVSAGDADQIEVCDPEDRDEDCDGGADERDPDGVPITAPLWYRDRDHDGFGDAADFVRACAEPDGYVAEAGDCDDDPAGCGEACRPGEVELCDARDNDCNLATGDGVGDASVGVRCDSDQDEDLCTDEIALCEGGVVTCPNSAEGDDGRVEICDAADADEDCDGGGDDADPQGTPATAPTWYVDVDGDGHGDASTAITVCDPPAGYVLSGADCDDDPDACGAACDPDLVESPDDGTCADGLDNDCDGVTDIDAGCPPATACYADADQDGFGDDERAITIAPAQVPTDGCAGWDDGDHPVGFWSDRGADCDDEDPDVNPEGVEVPGDERDEDCDGAVACWVDDDNDNYARDDATVVDAPAGETCAEAFHRAGQRGDCDDDLASCGASCSPAAIEICDLLDNDCDGERDEGLADCGDDDGGGVVDGGDGCGGCAGGAPSAAALWLLTLLFLLRRRRWRA